jgi:hypothetical protein
VKTRNGILAVTVLASALTACEVTNPGPVADEFLDLPEAHQALVNGAAARLSGGVGYVALSGGFAAREVFPTGQTNLSQSLLVQAGFLSPVDVGTHWSQVQQARWVAEDAVRRFQALPQGRVNAAVFAEAYLWAGFANRTLGENMCSAVFNGGPEEPSTKYFERAEAAFSEAITRGTGDVRTAAYAGRAAVRVHTRNWSGAASDAAQVPLAFVFRVAADPTDANTRNVLAYANLNTPYRAYSGIETWFIGYYNSTGDPRVQFTFDSRYPNGVQNLPGYGLVAWWPTPKYPLNNTPIRLASGREMALIRAEAALIANDWPAAMTLINSLRTSTVSRTTNQALQPWTAANITQAWTFLKRERGIELWLEGRRLGDIRRWEAASTPGTLDWPNFEALSSLFRNNPPSKCFPIPDSERETNPNLR